MEHLLEDSNQSINERYVGEISGRIKSTQEVIDLPFSAIAIFYQKPEEYDEAEINFPVDVQD